LCTGDLDDDDGEPLSEMVVVGIVAGIGALAIGGAFIYVKMARSMGSGGATVHGKGPNKFAKNNSDLSQGFYDANLKTGNKQLWSDNPQFLRPTNTLGQFST
jgi:hypothetical protein